MIAWSGVVYALYGMLALLLEPNALLWRERRAYVGNLTGTFVNRNTAATYFGTCAIVWFVTFLQEGRRYVGPNGTVRNVVTELVYYAPPRTLIVAAFGLGVTLAAVLATGSRAGTFLTALALGIGAVLWTRPCSPRSGVIAVGVLVLVMLMVELFGGALAGRISTGGLLDPARLTIYRETAAMISDAPWIGSGLGTFEFMFPAYQVQDAPSIGIVDRAHSSPLEFAAEIGIPAAVVILLSSVAMLRLLVLGSFRRRRNRSFPIAGAAVSILAGLHSLVDFSLQIPGYATVCAAVLGAGLAQCSATAPPLAALAAPSRSQRGS